MPESERAAEARRWLEQLFLATVGRVDVAGKTERAVAELPALGRVRVVAVGKAAPAMALGAERALGPRLSGGIVVMPQGLFQSPSLTLPTVVGGHPTADKHSLAAGKALLAEVRNAEPGETLLALISGGGSALAAVPASGLELADKVSTVAALMAAAAPIAEINTVRRHLSAIKGGALARACPVPVFTLVVSDVIGDALWDVASGPTVADPTTYGRAKEIIEERLSWTSLSPRIKRHIEQGIAQDSSTAIDQAGNRARLLLGFHGFADTAAGLALDQGMSVTRAAEPLEGPVEAVAQQIIAALVGPKPGVWLAGAEATVATGEHPGVGGRAQHLALVLARYLRGRAGVAVMVAGSDGIDGNSSAAGAIVDGRSWDEIGSAGHDGSEALRTFDSAGALAAIGAQIVTGPTGVNHADLVVVYRW